MIAVRVPRDIEDLLSAELHFPYHFSVRGVVGREF